MDETVSSETHRSLARCIFARLLHSSPSLQITDLGRAVIAPVLEYGRISMTSPTEPSDHGRNEMYSQLRDLLLETGTSMREETLIQTFRAGMIDGRLAAHPNLAPIVDTSEGVQAIQEQLVRYQLPLIDFLHCMAVLLITQIESAGLLRRDEDGYIKRAA